MSATQDADLRSKRSRLERFVARSPDHVEGVAGVDHCTFLTADLERVARFFVDMLGFRVSKVEPSQDHPESTQVFVDIGAGAQLVFSDFPYEVVDELDEGGGALHHLAVRVDPDRLRDLVERMTDSGHPFTGPIRRASYTSVYVRAPNGIMLEFMQGERLSD